VPLSPRATRTPSPRGGPCTGMGDEGCTWAAAATVGRLSEETAEPTPDVPMSHPLTSSPKEFP
jgi:hypothetical protein